MKKLEVRLVRQPGEERVIGQLAEAGSRPASRQMYFEYDPAFLRNPLWLSPFKLPPQPGLIEHREHAFGPIFGLFDDSLPDGWGLLLMDRFFEQQPLALAEVSVLDRLAYLGTRTMGALTYHPSADPTGREAQRLVAAAPRRCEPSLHGSFCYAIDDHNHLQVHSSWDQDVLLSVPEFEHRPLSARWVSAKLLYVEVSFNPHYGAYWLYDAVERRVILKQLENDGFDAWTQCRVRP